MIRLYRFLLHLLPRQRRERFGDEMAVVFAEQQRDAGAVQTAALWMKETTGLLRFSLRDRISRLRSQIFTGSAPRPPAGRFRAEFRWAWRGIRARGWRAVFIVALLAVAMAANTVVFSAADSFVFNRAPYHDVSRLAVLEWQARGRTSDYLPPDLIRQWREQQDLFTAVGAYSSGPSAYVTSGGITEEVSGEFLTPRFLDLLGVMPAYGRPFRNDETDGRMPKTAILADTLSRRLFGSPAAAIGQSMIVGANRVEIIGVMPAGFRFPSAQEQIWMPFDPSAWPTYVNVQNIVRVVPDRPFDALNQAVADRMPHLALPPNWANTKLTLATLTEARHDAGATLIFSVLAGAAGCLLLIACANVASLELATATKRARIFGIQAALGASRGTLLRSALLEGAGIVLVSAALAAAMAWWTTSVLTNNLTIAMRNVLVNPIDLDARAIVFMTTIAAITWGLTSLPIARRSLSADIVTALRDDTRVMPVSVATARTRALLMAGQVSLTVLLLVGALLYLRTYAAKTGLDKGFDATGLAYITLGPAPDAPKHGVELESEVLERIRSFPGVRGVSRTSSVPPYTTAGAMAELKITGRNSIGERIKLASYAVDPEYFATIGIPIVAGGNFSDGRVPGGEVIVDERFARKFFPAGDAVGQKFSLGSVSLAGSNELTIVGVAKAWRLDEARTAAGEDVYVGYLKTNYQSLSFVVKIDDERHLPALLDAVRAVAPRTTARFRTINELYGRLTADTRLAASVTSGFGAVALVVATAGVYGVMAFLVAGRRREIGIRMALGADRSNVQRLVFSSSLRFVLAGAVVGLCAALVASRWIAAQLFGVTTTDPATYASVIALVVVTALAATWYPARQASRVDPATTLRSE